VRFQVLTAASMMFKAVFWVVLPCNFNHFTRNYNPEDNSEQQPSSATTTTTTNLICFNSYTVGNRLLSKLCVYTHIHIHTHTHTHTHTHVTDNRNIQVNSHVLLLLLLILLLG
jgi:hypothetical protein